MKRFSIWKQLLFWLVVVAVGIGAGFGVAQYRVGWGDGLQYQGRESDLVVLGPWLMIRQQEITEDPLSLARLARFGPFPLQPSEVLYLTALKDSAGDWLDAGRPYTLHGKRLEARFWSITAYDERGYFFPNDADRFSYNHQNMQMDGDEFAIHLGPEPRSPNWLPTRGPGKMRVTLRLYQASPALLDNLNAEALPIIRQAGAKP